MEPSDVILRFLESVGTRGEAEYYLALFRADSKERFATIAVDAAVVKHAFDALVLDLRYLAGLGLAPVVVLGHVEPQSAAADAERLFRELARHDVPADVVAAASPELIEDVTEAARAGAVPIVHLDPDGTDGLEARFGRLGELVGGLGTRKLIFLGRRGGLRTRSGAGISLINLLAGSGDAALSKKQRALLVQCRRLLESAPHRMLIALTSPLMLLRELFTVKGAGTLIKLGSTVLRRDGYADVDLRRLRALLESSFDKTVVEGFFDRPVSRVYVEEEYRGAAVVVDVPELGGYLTKFAVTAASQGEGIGRDLWDVVTADFPVLFWRARPDNPITPWYVAQCDGMVRPSATRWQVFWRGLAVARIPAAVRYALEAPVDLEG